ncbi:hypothetical protein EMPS_08756 [Entomortierella parvispora]|uniref:Sds3-like-domain-containing protein n=1 Tax=Entomortierella parvispora TaxID=205924 RepID=A0A9P3HHG4_9FUNG|nr:hypothetical protein EMPS_08756 [Entomortierella parvispora]
MLEAPTLRTRKQSMLPSDLKGNALKDKSSTPNGTGGVSPTKREPSPTGNQDSSNTDDDPNASNDHVQADMTEEADEAMAEAGRSPPVETDEQVKGASLSGKEDPIEEKDPTQPLDSEFGDSQTDDTPAATPTDADEDKDRDDSTEGIEADQGEDGEEAEEGEFTDDGEVANDDSHQGQADGLDLLAAAEASIALAEKDQDEDAVMAEPDEVGTPTEQSAESEIDSQQERTDGSDEEEENDEDEDKMNDNEDQEDEEDNEDEEEAETPAAVVDFKKPSLLSQKPTLNRPQLIEEEKDSGDELSDLSEFDDTDDSDEEESTKATSEAASTPKAPSTSQINTRPSLGGRRKSLRETSRERREQEQERVKRERQDEEDDGDSSTNERPVSNRASQSKRHRRLSEIRHDEERDSGSDATEGEDQERKTAEEEEEEEEEVEEDAEVKLKQKQALDALSSIEEEFANLRDRMYDERMRELDKEVEMINEGTHPELSSLMREIEDKRHQRLRVAKAWRTHLGEIAQCQFEITEYQAHCTYQSTKRTARTDMARELGRKQRKLILELTLSSDTRRKNVTAEKQTLVRARKQRKYEVQEIRLLKERSGVPVTPMPPMLTHEELDEDFQSMGLARPVAPPSQPASSFDHVGGHHHSSSSRIGGSSMASSIGQRGGHFIDHRSHARPDVEIYVDGSRCMIDGIWYRPNDTVVVLDAAIGQYQAKYLFLADDEVMLQKTDGTKTRIHLDLFRVRKLYMQPKA